MNAIPPSEADARDPAAIFLADPNSHLGDVLYLYFRDYKRKLIYRFFKKATAAADIADDKTLRVADIGASMGYDMKYVLSRLGQEQPEDRRWTRMQVNLLEGDNHLIGAGNVEWSGFGDATGVAHRYVKCDISTALPLSDSSQDIVLCSEVVEHLEDPGRLLREIHRILRPGGRLILTTDNCPSALQLLKRIPARLAGRYNRIYARPNKSTTVTGEVVVDDAGAPIYGHINLNPTRYWERLAKRCGLVIVSFGTYESVRRGGGRKTPGLLALYFGVGFAVSLLPRRIGRFFGDTTALMLEKGHSPT